MSALIKQPIKEIKKEIDGRVYYFLIKEGKGILVAYGDILKDALCRLMVKINNKPKKYINSRIWRISISTFDEQKDKKKHHVFGDVLIMLENYTVSKDLIVIKKAEADKTGPIWMTKKWLEYNTWKYKYIKKIIKNVLNNTTKLKLKGPNIYEIDII